MNRDFVTRDRGLDTTPSFAETWEKALRQLVGKRVESVRVDEYGVVYITAAGLGGRVTAKIGGPKRVG